jgi:predicted house-cleaning noncanonical NTP pyrophosphatase (MazG superfamily)
MASGGSVKIDDLKRFRDVVEKNLGKEAVEQFIESCAKELAARLLAKVIKRTPVGDYSKEITVTAKRDSKKHKKGETYTKRINPTGKKGGTLRRGWTGEKNQSATAYAHSLNVRHLGNAYVIEIVNPVEYAPYVEFGHRTRSHNGWVAGKFMLTISEQEIQKDAPRILENKLKKKLGECFT